jgi:hypothetical protein
VRHRSSNDGALHQTGRLLPISDSLIASVMGSSYGAPRARQVLRKFNGPKPAPPGTARVKYHDTVILEIRRLKEQTGMMPKAISEHLAKLGIEITREEIIRILSYQTRGHLVPDEGADPYLPVKVQ